MICDALASIYLLVVTYVLSAYRGKRIFKHIAKRCRAQNYARHLELFTGGAGSASLRVRFFDFPSPVVPGRSPMGSQP